MKEKEKGCWYGIGVMLAFLVMGFLACMLIIIIGAFLHIGWNLVGSP